jgi:hypothetical protein
VSLDDAIEPREDEPMKTLTTMMTLVAAMTLLTANASAQSVDQGRATDRLDFNPAVQVVGASLGAGLGGLSGVFTGGFTGFLVCGANIFSNSCSSAVGIGALAGGLAGGVGGSVLGAGILGGDYATSRDYGVAAAGGAAGLLLSVPVTLAMAGAMRGAYVHNDTVLWTNIATMSLMTGLGASLGYQSGYSVPWVRDVALTPMVGGEYDGLVLSGRF